MFMQQSQNKRASRSLLRQVPKTAIPFDTVVIFEKINFPIQNRSQGALWGLILAPFWHPFGLHLAPFGSPWAPFGARLTLLARFGAPFGAFLLSQGYLLHTFGLFLAILVRLFRF